LAVVTMKSLLESGVHFGHQTKRWDPRMKRYIFAERNGIHIIDLQKTIAAIKEAYDELGYPGVDFDETLVRAMGELLETPVVEGPIKLEQKVLSFSMTDPALEGLSPAQKNLLRLGPRGVRAAHDKIKELAAALGVPASRLPQTRTYTPSDL